MVALIASIGKSVFGQGSSTPSFIIRRILSAMEARRVGRNGNGSFRRGRMSTTYINTVHVFAHLLNFGWEEFE